MEQFQWKRFHQRCFKGFMLLSVFHVSKFVLPFTKLKIKATKAVTKKNYKPYVTYTQILNHINRGLKGIKVD